MQLVDIRKKLHSLAEIAHDEKETADFVVNQLREVGVSDIRGGIGGYGLVATTGGDKDGPSVLFRAELDALPIDETIDVPYASKKEGVSHKCGHDGHMAILIGLARELQERPVRNGKVHFLFQPAEETGEGATRMLEDDLLSNYKPDFIFALHNLPGYPLHTVLLRDDVFAAGSSGLIVRLKGQAAHAAHPEYARSPASAVAGLIQEWQSLPQSVIPFDRAGLLTVIHARIGEQDFGTTPGYAELMATIRAHEPDDLDKLGERAVALAETAASRWGLKIDYEWTEVFQPTRNDPDAVALVEKVAKKLHGRGGDKVKNSGKAQKGDKSSRPVHEIIRLKQPFSWSEDFGRFTEKCPGALFGLGSGSDHPQMHDSRYDFPDELLETGVRLFSGIIDEMGLR